MATSSNEIRRLGNCFETQVRVALMTYPGVTNYKITRKSMEFYISFVVDRGERQDRYETVYTTPVTEQLCDDYMRILRSWIGDCVYNPEGIDENMSWNEFKEMFGRRNAIETN